MRNELHLRINRPISHPLSILLLVGFLIAALWYVLLLEQQRNHLAVENNFKLASANLSRAFEEHVVRTFTEVDEVLLMLRRAWEEDRSTFNQKVRFFQSVYPKSLLVQIAVIDANGKLAYSNLNPNAKPIDLSDREHFRVHRDRKEDKLFISKPVKGRVSGRYSIQMTRPILKNHGQFDGVLVISLSPQYFARFFHSVDLGTEGSIALIGTDGIFRARGSNFKMDNNSIGIKLPPNRPFLQPNAPAQGSYEAVSAVDGIKRLITYRHVSGYPMVVSVTNSVKNIFAEHDQRWFRYRIYAGVLSLLMALGGISLARALYIQRQFRSRLLSVNDSLRTLNDIATQSDDDLETRLQKALVLGCRHLGLESGIIGRIADDRYYIENCVPKDACPQRQTDFPLSNTLCTVTVDHADVIAINQISESEYARHTCSGSSTQQCYIGAPTWVGSDLYGTVNFFSTQAGKPEFNSSDIEFVRLLARWVSTVLAEAHTRDELTKLATTDALTGAKSRGYFTRTADKEIRRAQRYNHPLSMILIDVDYFKRVNDEYGHHAGDEALRSVAQTCQESLRDSDLFARLGGEEFAVLLPYTPESEAAAACERIRRGIEDTPIKVAGNLIHVTVSAGVAQVEPDEDFKSVYNRVDSALYEAKGRGRNCVATATSALSSLS